MMKTLQHLSAITVAAGISKGKYKHIHFELNTVLSDLIFFNMLHSTQVPLTLEVMEEVSKKLNVSRTFLETKFCDPTFFKMLRLKKLFIKGFEPFKNKYRASLATNATIDIVTLLKDVLTPDSQKQLEVLDFYGATERFPYNWIVEIGQLLPSLKHLSMGDTVLSPIHLRDISSYCTKLVVLNLTGSKLPNLHGIWTLCHLKALGLCDLQFNSKKDLCDLFYLKKLEVLEIGGWDMRNLQTFNQYMESGKSLSNLTKLDCSHNAVSEESIRKLKKTHPKLQIVSLLGCALKKFDVPQVTQLTALTLRDCIASLDHYYPSGSHAALTVIFERLHYILHTSYARLSVDEIQDCFEAIIRATEEIPENHDVMLPAINSMAILCLKERIQVFSTNQKHKVALLFMRSCSKFGNRHQVEHNSIHETVWNSMRHEDFLFTPHLFTFGIYQMAFYEAQCFPADHDIAKYSLEVMSKLVDICDRERLMELDSSKGDHLGSLTSLLNSASKTDDFSNFRLCMELVFKYVKVFPEKTLLIRETTTSLLEKLKTVNNDNYAIEILEKLNAIVEILEFNDKLRRSREFCTDFFNREDFKLLLQSTTVNRSLRTEKTIVFLASLYFYNQPVTIENYKEVKDKLVMEIQDDIEKHPTGYLEDLKQGEDGISKEISDWTEWLVKHIE